MAMMPRQKKYFGIPLLTRGGARCNLRTVLGEGLVHQEIHNRALKRAAEILGGEEQLRLHLGVTEGDFSSWTGVRELPRNIFLRLVDIITEEEVRQVRRAART